MRVASAGLVYWVTRFFLLGTKAQILGLTQGPNEKYAGFLARLETAISCTVIGEEAKRQLEKLLAYENANQECQRAIAPIRDTGFLII